MPGAISYCFDCSATFNADLKVCPRCGSSNHWAAKVRADAPDPTGEGAAQDSINQMRCPTCRTTYPWNAEYCPNCMAPNGLPRELREQIAPGTSVRVVQGVDCPRCNTLIPLDDGWCPSCHEENPRRTRERQARVPEPTDDVGWLAYKAPSRMRDAWMAALAAFLVVVVVVLERVSTVAGGIAALVCIPVAAFLGVAWWIRRS